MNPDVKKLHEAANALRLTDAFRSAMDNLNHNALAQDSTPRLPQPPQANLPGDVPRPQIEAMHQEPPAIPKHHLRDCHSLLRSVSAWVIGFIFWVLVGASLSLGGNLLGVPSVIQLADSMTITHGGGRFSYDEEVSSLQTFYGEVGMVFALLLALWAGRTVYWRSFGAGFTEVGRFTFFAWLIAVTALLCLALFYHLAFAKFHGPFAYYSLMLLQLLSVVGVVWASHQWFKNRVAGLTVNNQDQL